MFITTASFLGFTTLVAAISYAYTRRDHMTTWDAYFLGGRSLTGWVIAGSLMLTNLSTEHLIGLNGDAFKHTIAVTAWETTAALAMVGTALYFLPRFLRMGLSTLPEYLAARFDPVTGVIAATVLLFSYVLAILPVVLLFGASGINSLFGLQQAFGLSLSQVTWLLVWGIGVLGSAYAIFGGLKAVAISDTINGVGFLIAGLLVPVLALAANRRRQCAERLGRSLCRGTPEVRHHGRRTRFLPAVRSALHGNGRQPDLLLVRRPADHTARAGRQEPQGGPEGHADRSLLQALGPLVIVLPGVLAYHIKDTLGPEDYLQAYPTLVRAVLPEWMAGFFAAVMVGAVLSTFNSVLNSSATLFCRDIYGSVMRSSASPRELVAVGRACSIVLAITAMSIAPLIDTSGSLYNYLQRITPPSSGPCWQ